eukprot:gene13066-17515_t
MAKFSFSLNEILIGLAIFCSTALGLNANTNSASKFFKHTGTSTFLGPSRITIAMNAMNNESPGLSTSVPISSTFKTTKDRVGLGIALITTGSILGFMTTSAKIAFAKELKYPIMGQKEIMSAKAHGTSMIPVQSKLKWGCDRELADRICNFNRNWAEFAGYWTRDTTFLKEVNSNEVTTFYDSVTGKPLFKSPVGRSFEEWKQESMVHGWPSFRDNEVIWENVRSLRDGEMVSLTGTHLGHNLPDRNGNRYCINLVSIAGYPVESVSISTDFCDGTVI